MVNKVILVGNVGADPEIRSFEDGSKVARINLATTERIFNSKTQERTDRTEWHRLTIWRGLANVVEQYVRKGSQLYVEGRIRTNEWTDANGVKRYGTEIVVDNLSMLGRREGNSQGQYQGQGDSYGASSKPSYQSPQGGQDSPTQNFNNQPQDINQQKEQPTQNYDDSSSESDDLPF